MLNKEKHQLIMGRILRDIYSDVTIASLMGLKGGTAAYFFYGLPRFSVDLDFDLLTSDEATQKQVFEKIETILQPYGTLRDKALKRYTIFFMLSYGEEDHNIKVEISTREIPDLRQYYEIKEHLGIPMLAAKKDYLFAGKLAALKLRKETAMRDVYDICYFAKNNWGISEEAIKIMTGKKLKDHLADCLPTIERLKDNQLLQGLGELLDAKEKIRVKTSLKPEVIFLLKNYISVLKK